jgi:serine/threonine protein kinase
MRLFGQLIKIGGWFLKQLLLEYCDGGALDSIMLELEHGLSESQIAYVASQLITALSYLHECKVIHRDLKAGNVLVTTEGGVKLGTWIKMMMKEFDLKNVFVRTQRERES